MIDVSLSKNIFDTHLKKIITKNNKTILIGIDGPTASGKTILANQIRDLVSKRKKCFVYRLDWTLINRKSRLKDLKSLKKHSKEMPYEASLHMRLNNVEEFLKEIKKLDFRNKKKRVALKNLYAREKDGKTIGKEILSFHPGMIIILEGHYTLESKLARYIDLNILLMGNSKELIKRKKNRVKDYRKSDDVEDYFQRIDLPSFKNHLSRFLFGADIIIDNSNFKKPLFKKTEYLFRWMSEEKSIYEKVEKPSTIKECIDTTFSRSLESKIYRDLISRSIKVFFKLDKKIYEYLTTSIDQIDCDLTDQTKKIIEKLNISYGKLAKFELIHTNAIYNIYKRKLPITFGINIYFKKTRKSIQLLIEVKNNEISFNIIWDNGSTNIRLYRDLGKNINYEKLKLTFLVEKTQQKNNKISVFSPATFLIPSFLKNEIYNLVLTDHEEENISSIACIENLNKFGGILIRRFSTFIELSFFKKILHRVGFNCVNIGNYVIAIKVDDLKLKNKFKLFSNDLDVSFLNKEFIKKSENAYDKIIKKDRLYVKNFVKKYCKDFSYFDERIYEKKNIQSKNFYEISIQIQKMLNSRNRLMRKKISQFIIEKFPNLKVNISRYWNTCYKTKKKYVNYAETLEIQPSILSEVYLWLNLRGENSAILGANIYDINKSSLDCLAYLSSSFENKTPIVLQASLNAVGQKEIYNGQVTHGYLFPKYGVNDFIYSATNAAKEYFLETGHYSFLYGVGLDHVNVENDIPLGRAKRFLTDAINSDLVTHYVLDGSKKFKIKQNKENLFRKAYEPVINYALTLLDSISSEKYYIHDKEICAGELNYSENDNSAIIPTPENFLSFVQTFQKFVERKKIFEISKRPILFIGNLGTTHHGKDKSPPKVELSNNWKKKIQRFNFISAVLHGTTNTHSDYLRKSTSGCHKVNVAGDLLHTLLNSLPIELKQIIEKSRFEKKKSLYLIRDEMEILNKKSRENIISKLKAHCDSIQKNISSPKLTSHDISYFKYKPYKYDRAQVVEIINSIQKKLDENVSNYNSIQKRNRSFFSASMIEVTFDNFYKKIVKMIYKEGIKYFHIDVGDGDFITRKINALDKVSFLKKNFKNIKIHCHLMVKNPHMINRNKSSYIDKYCKAGCDRIALHERSFKSMNDLEIAINLIKKRNVKPGIVVETSRAIDEKLFELIKKNKIDWIVIMGVVVGYGGQIFNNNVFSKIKILKNYFQSIKKPLIIEVDGGLNNENIGMCLESGADILSGWSIVKDNSPEKILSKIRNVKKICENEVV